MGVRAVVEEREVNSFSNLSSSSEVQAYQLLTGRCVNFLNSLPFTEKREGMTTMQTMGDGYKGNTKRCQQDSYHDRQANQTRLATMTDKRIS